MYSTNGIREEIKEIWSGLAQMAQVLQLIGKIEGGELASPAEPKLIWVHVPARDVVVVRAELGRAAERLVAQ